MFSGKILGFSLGLVYGLVGLAGFSLFGLDQVGIFTGGVVECSKKIDGVS
jgi:hypothetical protein